MAEGSRISARLNATAVPVLDEVWPLACQGVYPGGATRNRERVEPQVGWAAAVPEETRIVLTDPQTSGGLLIAIAQSDVDQLLNCLGATGVLAHAVIGELTGQAERIVEITQ